MARNRKHLEGLLEIIKQVNTEEENSWFKKRLADSLVEGKTELSIPEENDRIVEIHEHFFRSIIKRQAELFYEAIPYKDKKQQLVNDFMKMEYARRMNDFEGFCLAMYQQVELIVVHVYKSETIYLKVDEKKDSIIRVRDNYMVCHFLAKNKASEYVDKLYKNDPEKWFFNQKFRAVVLFKYMEKETIYIDLNLIEKICEIANYLSLGRNQVHRGGAVFESQERKLIEINNDPQRFYLRFLGFLEEFVSLVCIKAPLKPKSNERFGK